MNVLIFLLSLVVLICSYKLFKQAAGTMSAFYFNIISWNFYLQLCLLSFIGANLSVMGIQHYLIDYSSAQGKWMGYWATLYVMLAMPISMVLTQQLLLSRRIRAKAFRYFTQPLRLPDGRQAIIWYFLSAIALLATAYVYYKTKTIPLLGLLSNSVDSLANFRAQTKFDFSGNYYVRNLFSLFLAPFVTYVAYGYYRFYGRRAYLLWFVASLAISLLALTYNSEKGPIIFFFLAIFHLRNIINGRGRWSEYVIAAVIVVGLVLFAYIAFAGVALNSDTLLGILKRVLLTQYAGVPLSFDAFPHQVEFLNGGSLPDWMTQMLGVEHKISARVLAEVFLPTQVSQGTAGVVNSLFIAESWANWGWSGLLLAPIWVGFIIQIIYYRLLTAPKTPANLAMMAYFFTGLPLTGGVVAFMWNVTWLFLIVLVLTISTFDISKHSAKIRLSSIYPHSKRRMEALKNSGSIVE